MSVLRTVLLLCTLCLAAVPNPALGGWGEEVNRASAADLNDLTHAEQELWSAEKTIQHVVGGALAGERQRQLLGVASDDATQRLFNRTVGYWLIHILKPGAQIVTNPAASCAEAMISYTKLLEIDRQRQLFGLTVGDGQPADSGVSQVDTLFTDIKAQIAEALARRCHEEALDECVYTGRISAVTGNA